MKVRVDRDICIGAANCAAFAPTVFEMDAENKAVVLDPSSVDEQTLWTAVESCPVKAIILEDDRGNQLYP